MATFRVNKNKDYTIMSNHHLRDKNLSLKAKGLLSFMLSLPENWDYSINGLVAVSKEGKKAIRAAIKELEDTHYLKRERNQYDKGRFDYDYLVFETPYTQKGYMDNGHTDNEPQKNTKETTIDNKDKKDKPIHNLVRALVKKQFITEYDLDIYNYNSLIYELLEEYQYSLVITALNYTIQRWKLNKGYDENYNTIENKFAYFKKAMQNNLKRLTEEVDLGW